MPVCTHCGAEPAPDAIFCHRCGHPFVAHAGLVPPELSPPPAKSRKGFDVSLLVINLVLFVAIQATLIFVVPIFAAMFMDFGSALPTPTQLLVDGANFLKSYYLLAYPVSGLLICAVVHFSLRRGDLRGWFVLVAVLQLLLIMAMGLALFLPISQLGAVAGNLQ